MFQTLTSLTEVPAKIIWRLQPHRSERWAQREAQTIRDTNGARFVQAGHLAASWAVPLDDLLARLAAFY